MKKNIKSGAVKYYPIGEVISGSILNALGVKLDPKSIENYDNLLHNPVALEKMKSGLENLTNKVVTPVVNNAVNQMAQPVSEGIHKAEASLLNAGVSVIPLVGDIVNTGKSLTNAANAGLETFTAVTDITKSGIEQIQEQAAELNQLNQLNKLNEFNNKVASAQNVAAKNINNKVASAQNVAAIPKNNSFVGRRGGAILSRIKKSVKQFIGKKRTKTAKNININIKGRYSKNKNKKNIISQKGGQILSRINESLKTFNNM